MIYDNLADILDTYQILVADPPWDFSNSNLKRACGRTERADYHYKSKMTLKEVKNLPIFDLSEPTSVLILWTTDAHTEFAFECVKHWGFRLSTKVFLWVKLQNGIPVKNVGPWTMKSTESAWLATRGNAHSTLLKTQAELQLIMTERGEHSEKPEVSYERINRMFPNTTKADLFARKTRPGWDSFGDEVEDEL